MRMNEENKINSENTFMPKDMVVSCARCKTNVQICKNIGKYRCPKCRELLVIVKDYETALFVGSGEKMQKYNITKPNSLNNSEFVKNKPEFSKGHCPNCGQRLNLISNSDTCPRCNPITENKTVYSTPSQSKINYTAPSQTKTKTNYTAPSQTKNKSDRPQTIKTKKNLPMYVLLQIMAFPYFILASKWGFFDFFGIYYLSGMEKLLGFFVSIGISIFGGIS